MKIYYQVRLIKPISKMKRLPNGQIDVIITQIAVFVVPAHLSLQQLFLLGTDEKLTWMG